MRRILAITILALLCSLSAFAQITVKGVVKDSSGIPLPGVGVVEKGSRRGVISGDDGAYSITLKSQDSVLEFSCLGMKTHTENISGRNVIDVTMEDDAIGLEEVVAIGYGSIKREEITTAVSRVKSEDFIKGGVTSPLSLLQGKVAGLGMSVTSGDPGASPSISFRGISTLAASTSPLIVIDGIAGGNLNSISPEDIESIDVLKDGSAAAIYGTRGTNGVIIINTRQASGGRFEMQYDAYAKYDMLEGDHDRLTAAQWREKMSHPDIYPGMQDYGADTDWVKAISRNPFSHNHYLSARGSMGASGYVASANYSDKQGIYKTSFDKSLALKLGIKHSMADGKLKLDFNLHDRIVKHGYCPDELYNDASLRNPTMPLYNEDGSYFQTNNQSPLCALNEWRGINKNNSLSTSGKLSYEPLSYL
ncbi:MAG: TonB-dependent receptor plug domain-containing protein, partial [Bacteroidales bacterium]|nr:TonB-dependent receptor plug domain-containing protein [Bacteroidales bacterium]